MAIPRFASLINDLKTNYDVIILDVPPVGLISQSFEILKCVDIILYMFRFNYSEKSFISELNGIKIGKGIHNIYAVLNDLPNKKMKYGKYRYNYYAQQQSKKSFLKNLFTRKEAAL
jgi:hypothetical protein